eukprot:gnl/TRDRNA2_/TRDRNA2_34341_c0_seq1.p1 gnl/TRDRNA2_/TRDRNA2_34341_c0~~gnl/TRDRNA2_/TRDRNA2_34341_c0_seq1.p1  ORF type:complete len:368 (+),score=30.40 gnl/TRDRNA2_/TRDRNA2_34341_c0_seq1:52-1155(+)
MKPDITFFNEGFPLRFKAMQRNAIFGCDLVLVLGTSLSVKGSVTQVLTQIITMKPNVPLFLINKNPVHLPKGKKFDAYLIGTCDDICQYLAVRCFVPEWPSTAQMQDHFSPSSLDPLGIQHLTVADFTCEEVSSEGAVWCIDRNTSVAKPAATWNLRANQLLRQAPTLNPRENQLLRPTTARISQENKRPRPASTTKLPSPLAKSLERRAPTAEHWRLATTTNLPSPLARPLERRAPTAKNRSPATTTNLPSARAQQFMRARRPLTTSHRRRDSRPHRPAQEKLENSATSESSDSSDQSATQPGQPSPGGSAAAEVISRVMSVLKPIERRGAKELRSLEDVRSLEDLSVFLANLAESEPRPTLAANH